jgi:non-specific serine/threonine protein kinase
VLDLVWLNGSVFALGNSVSVGVPTEIHVADRHSEARRLTVPELLELETEGLELGATARALLAVVGLARRAVTDGLVHPQLARGGTTWYAFWGATLDEPTQTELDALVAAAPVAAGRLDELYPQVVDEIARGRLLTTGVRLDGAQAPALAAFLHGLTAADPELPPGPLYSSLEHRLARWVDAGLEEVREVRWQLGLHLDERPGGDVLVLELWLQASDDPSLALPVSLLRRGIEGFAFVRDGDPEGDLAEQLAELEPIFAEHGIELAGDAAELDLDAATVFLRDLRPRLEARGVPVLLPAAWVRAPARIRADVRVHTQSSGLLSPEAIAAFDWRLAVGDVELGEAELAELVAAKSPVIRASGRWLALRPADVTRAIRFLEHRRGGGVVDLVRAVSGLDTDEAGLELGEVAVEGSLADLLAGADGRFRPLPTPSGMRHGLFAFQERGHGWLRLLGDLGIGGILADDMGLGKTVQAIAMLVSERDEARAQGPTLVVCPMSVARQWVAEAARFAPDLRVHLHHGSDRLADAALIEAVRRTDVVVTSYDIATRDVDTLAAIVWDRVLLDEAQDVKNPQTKRARALRRIPARRRLAMTGTPLENHLGELWSLMDILNPGLLGSREWFARTFQRPIEIAGDEAALERLRAIVRPFVLRRTKDSPEVELDLPPITVEKDYCRLTVEQASLYQATVDHWLPRVEAHEDRFGRRGAVLAMLGHLKQVCNHPEMLMHTGSPLEGRSGKLDRLVELLAGIPDEDKALVFTQYPSFDRLVPYLGEQLGREVGFFHGRLNAHQREELLAAFAAEGGPTVLVVSIRAGGRGLNLPAANHVFHFDRWWNPAVEQQATDRAHRVGQRKPVFVHSLICLGTLEERIDQLLDSKRELAAKVLAGRAEDWLGDLDLGAICEAVALSPDSVVA